MINYNGILSEVTSISITNNRGFLYGDAIFETLKIVNNKILFLEDHYFRLMASMRIVRMDIPMDFTMEFMEEQILKTINANPSSVATRARITFYRNDGGFYLPSTNSVSFVITTSALINSLYTQELDTYKIELFTDFYLAKNLLTTLKTTNRLLNITASIFANENGFDNCLLLNETKNVVEALQGNIFMLKNNQLITPPLSEGCLNGIMRKQILHLATKINGLDVVEEIISPFDLQNASELFVTNTIKGIQSVTHYRKKIYQTELANKLLRLLNELVLA